MNIKSNESKGFILLVPAAIISVVVVFGLLLLMKTLITTELEEPDEGDRVKIADIWQEQNEIEDQVKERKAEEIDQPDEPPPDIPKQDIELDADVDAIDISATVSKGDVDISVGGGFSDGDIIPLVAITPDYPRRALERGLEGYVVVRFVITTSGIPRDIVVEESTSSIFERSAIRAAQRLKYKPRIIDGNPVEVDHYYKFTFELAK